MKLGSLFDGSGGFPLAGALFGVEPAWASEIEPYPMRVTAARFPRISECGKTYKELSAATEDGTSGPSLKRSAGSKNRTLMFLSMKGENGNLLGAYWETVTALPGGCTTLNSGESPSEGKESTLSQILEVNVPEKYFLSRTACAGILRRAERRGKVLPDMLREALMEVVSGSDGCDCD